MPKLVRVPIHRTSPTQTVQVEVGATVGAQIGVNLLMPDGSLATTAKLQALFGDGTPSDGSINTTDDLEEGQWNLWFTDLRAQDAVGGILADTATIDLAYTAGTSITATLKDLADSGTGTLQAVTFDAKGRKTGSRAATITGTAGRITVAHGDASDGLPTIDLATVADAGGGTLQRTAFDAYGRKTGTSAATTTDLTEGANLYFTNARADARADVRIAVAKADPDGIASLVGGKLDPGQLPALAITETFVVNTQAAMLALSAQEGDVAVRTDLSKSFILTAAPPSTLANWQELLTPMSPVTSVFGRTGPVVAAMGDYTPAQVGAEPAIAAGTTAQYWRGDKTWRDFATDVRAAVLTGLSMASSAVITATDSILIALGKLQAQISLKMNDASVSALAESNATQTIPSATFQKVLLGSEVYDSGFYDPATSRFTPNKAGKYVAIGMVSFSGSGPAGNRIIAAATKNGTVDSNMTASTQTFPTNSVQHVFVYDMNGTTDYLELFARYDAGISLTITGASNTSMTVYRIGS